jgi:PAS domain S-box-containing protein
VPTVKKDSEEGMGGRACRGERDARGRTADGAASLALDALEHGEAAIVLDPDLRIRYVNANAERLSQRSRDELLGRVIGDAFPDAAAADAPYRSAIERVMRARVAETFDAYYRPLGIWTAVSVHPMRRGGVAVFVRDVTARKRAEAALREQEAFANRILASSLNGIYVIDLRSGEPVFVNARYAQLTGYGLEDPRDPGHVRRRLGAAAAAGRCRSRRRRPRGAWRSTSATPASGWSPPRSSGCSSRSRRAIAASPRPRAGSGWGSRS